MTVPFDIEAFKRDVADEVTARLRTERDTRPLYSSESLAVKLNISRRSARQKMESGEIASFKVGGLCRVDPAVVDAYLAAQRGADDAA